MPMRYLWFSAFAICGLAAWAWIETWAHAHREAHQRLLEELNTKIPACLQHGYSEPCGLCNSLFSGAGTQTLIIDSGETSTAYN